MPEPDMNLRRGFSNIGFSGQARRFPGFPPRSEAVRHFAEPRACVRFDLKAGDILSIRPSGCDQALCLLAFGEDGRCGLGHLGLKPGRVLPRTDFDGAVLSGWIAGKGAETPGNYTCAEIRASGLTALKAAETCTVWAVRPLAADALVSGRACGLIELAHKPASSGTAAPLPPPLGEIREEFTVRRGSARAYGVKGGEFVQIIDVEGQQCSDFVALRRGRLLDEGAEIGIDGTATRTMVRGAYPVPGLLDKFFDQELRPVMRVVQDTCGQHDTFGIACTARGYEERGFPGHLNCSDNISSALDPYGVAARAAWPAVNFFWSTWIDQNSHQLMTEESRSRPGDYVVLGALDDLVCVSTACPDDIDPINGWNPTDVHVRIYRPEAPIRRAAAYREREDASMSLTRESAFHPATSKLTGQFAPARDVWAPVTYPAIGVIGEYWACRERVTLQDMSSLRKFDIIGPDSERLMQLAVTRDVSRVAVWRGIYALICDEAGSVIDDGVLFRLAPDLYRWCCGAEESARTLEAIAGSEGLQVRIHGIGGALPSLALQGPNSRDVLSGIVFTQPTVPALDDLKRFGVTMARLGDRDGAPFMLSRSGYTGELGYELFCAASDGPEIWDAVMAAGEPCGIAPMGSSALEILRIEAGLAAPGAEFGPGIDAFEAGLGFAVELGKDSFVGKAALERNARAVRRVLKGLMFEGPEAPLPGSPVFAGERPVGTVTSAAQSPKFGRAIAMARIAVEFSACGRELEAGQLDGRMKRLPAAVCDIPFYDPKRERARA